MTAIERIFRALFVARERGCSIHELMAAAYDGRHDGGPLCAVGALHGSIWWLNHRHLIPLGARIVTGEQKSKGARYRLVVREAANVVG